GLAAEEQAGDRDHQEQDRRERGEQEKGERRALRRGPVPIPIDDRLLENGPEVLPWREAHQGSLRERPRLRSRFHRGGSCKSRAVSGPFDPPVAMLRSVPAGRAPGGTARIESRRLPHLPFRPEEPRPWD